ncbi:MAG TPA: indole-3-glycerol phosphate synthase TrpC [Solirubrobacterales bacterium]|nr:indole-3-glycerol phosphate synthase TrpC [Solirubrobacterales bacterium]
MTVTAETKIHDDMLPKMLEAARQGVKLRKRDLPLEKLKDRVDSREDRRPFGEALTGTALAVIAEYKRESPSAGQISTRALQDQVRVYEENGAAALSVLTDSKHFGGSLEDLQEARDTCDLPILRKDFVVDPYQLYEAAANGADAVLLIVRALVDEDVLRSMYEQARELDLDCLVEVHNEKELEQALDLDADIIGINTRDLDSGVIYDDLVFDLMPRVPTGKTVVAASGIKGESELPELERVGVDAVLIGSTFMAAKDPASVVRRFTGALDGTREHELP